MIVAKSQWKVLDVDNSHDRKCKGYHHHVSASELRRRIGDQVWNSDSTFCFERDQWDTVSNGLLVDQVFRYEKLSESAAVIARRLKLPAPLHLPLTSAPEIAHIRYRHGT